MTVLLNTEQQIDAEQTIVITVPVIRVVIGDLQNAQLTDRTDPLNSAQCRLMFIPTQIQRGGRKAIVRPLQAFGVSDDSSTVGQNPCGGGLEQAETLVNNELWHPCVNRPQPQHAERAEILQ